MFFQEVVERDSLVSTTNASKLTVEIFAEEIKRVLFSIGSYKVIGLDDYSDFFLKKVRRIVGDHFYDIMQELIFSNCMLKHFNINILCIMPKKGNVEVLRAYWPISCC